jgi:hypothetical protein
MFVSLSDGRFDEDSIMGMWLFDDGKGDTATMRHRATQAFLDAIRGTSYPLFHWR